MQIDKTSNRDPGRYCPYCGAFKGCYHSKSCHYTGIFEAPQLETARGDDGVAITDSERDVEVFDRHHITITIPPEVVQYAPEISRFVEAMVYKLGVHSGKGKWEGMRFHSLLPKLHGEVDELQGAINRENMVEILLEAADVANYALIIAAIAMERK